ncbi:MAG: DUF6134 family protein [Bacteroidota bacterium]
MLKRNLLFAFILISGICHSANAQTLHYDVVKGNKVLGSMTVERTKVGSETQYAVESLVNYKLLLSFKIEYELDERFENGVLVDGSATNSLNDKPQKHSVVKWDGDKYVVNLNGELSQVNREGILLSIPQLYFNRPVNQPHIFSQQFAGFIPLYEKSKDAFVLDSPDGKNYYSYDDEGICEEVKVSRSFATFYFKLKEKVNDSKGVKGKKVADIE